jgi:hypothetical protein
MGGVEAEVECGVGHERGNQLVVEVVVAHTERGATEKHAGDEYRVTPSIERPSYVCIAEVRCMILYLSYEMADVS